MDRRATVHDPGARRHHHVDVIASERLRSLDVVRGVALLGVIALNYHGMLNGQEAFAPTTQTILSRVFNPVSGVLTTRFAATFVFVAGIGVTLMAVRSRQSSTATTTPVQLTLLRRGAFLLLVGYGLEWIWPGTILFYYGAYFMLASVLVKRSTRTLAVTAVVACLSAAMVNLWRVSERFNDNYTTWLDPASPDSPRNVSIRLFLGYTHPVLPWIAFFLAGMIVARQTHGPVLIPKRLAMSALGCVVAAYVIRDMFRPSLIRDRGSALRSAVVSLQPFDRGVLFVVSTLGIAVLAVWSIERIVANRQHSLTLNLFARAGRMSLTLYVMHIFVYEVLVDTLGAVRPTGLDTALALTCATYVGGLVLSSIVLRHFTHGPIEFIYRKIGGR